MPPRDQRDTPIEVGSRVAYNLSGYVAIGTVVALTYGRRFPAKIMPDRGVRAARHGRVSTVKNPSSVLVLKPGDADAPA